MHCYTTIQFSTKLFCLSNSMMISPMDKKDSTVSFLQLVILLILGVFFIRLLITWRKGQKWTGGKFVPVSSPFLKSDFFYRNISYSADCVKQICVGIKSQWRNPLSVWDFYEKSHRGLLEESSWSLPPNLR